MSQGTKLFIILSLLLLCVTLPAFAQEVPTVEGSIGYSGIRSNGEYINGFSANAGYNALRTKGATLGGEFEFAGFYENGAHLHTFQLGPIAQFGTKDVRFFGRSLFGGARVSANGFANNIFGGTIGGGVKIPFGEYFHGRVGIDWVFFRNAGQQVNGAKVTVGIGFGK